jgi:mRNA interferase MazF
MKEGDIILIALRQADGQFKNRPALLLRSFPPFGDWLICGISSQLHQRVPDFDEVLALADLDYASSGLRAESVIRLGFLAVVPVRDILGSIGSVAPERHHRLLDRLSNFLHP